MIVTGTPEEKELVASIASQIEGAAAATDLPLLAAAALIKRMDLLISNDTGPMHLAFAVKTPTVGLFTPTDPDLCGPYLVENAFADRQENQPALPACEKNATSLFASCKSACKKFTIQL